MTRLSVTLEASLAKELERLRTRMSKEREALLIGLLKETNPETQVS